MRSYCLDDGELTHLESRMSLRLSFLLVASLLGGVVSPDMFKMPFTNVGILHPCGRVEHKSGALRTPRSLPYVSSCDRGALEGDSAAQFCARVPGCGKLPRRPACRLAQELKAYWVSLKVQVPKFRA